MERLQRALLLAEEVGLGLALPFPLQRVAVERVVGDFLLPGLQQFGSELVGVDAGECVIYDVLQVVGVAALSSGAEQDRGFRDKDAAPRLLRRYVGIY